MSATQARVNFGEVMRQVVERNRPIIVERAGKPQVVILSIESYEQLIAAQRGDRDDILLEQAKALRERIQARLGDAKLPAPEDIIAQMREERTRELTDLH
ncbi:MAG: type II toxin-antitoxin system Phd/YefM family antitoxin [Anaerolineae bacterium]